MNAIVPPPKGSGIGSGGWMSTMTPMPMLPPVKSGVTRMIWRITMLSTSVTMAK